MSVKSAALLTVLMLSAIMFMAVGMLSVDASGSIATSDGYGISELQR